MTVPFEQSPVLASQPGVRHAFFGRRGGQSTGVFASLNVSDAGGDDAANVASNRDLVAGTLGFTGNDLVILKQIHSNRVVTVTEPMRGPRMEADAMVTRLPGIGLGILTADCTPILLADAEAGVVGAAHAGWRGAVDGIVGNTVAAMVDLGARPGRIVAAVGPTITGPNYEVGPQFMADFLALHPGGRHYFFTPSGRREHFELPLFVVEQLASAGVGAVERIPACTYASPERYFSHRYATHRGTTTGRQIAVIARF